MVKKKTCIFISGNGSNLNNLIKNSRDYVFPISVSLVISNNPSAGGIKYARKNSIPFILQFFLNLIRELMVSLVFWFLKIITNLLLFFMSFKLISSIFCIIKK